MPACLLHSGTPQMLTAATPAPSAGGKTRTAPKGSFTRTGVLGSEASPHCFPRGLLAVLVPALASATPVLCPAPWPDALPTLRFFRVPGKPNSSLIPPLVGQPPCPLGIVPNLWLQEHRIPLIHSLVFSDITWVGGKGRGLWGCQGPEFLMFWEVSTIRMMGHLGSRPLPGCPFPVELQNFPFLKSSPLFCVPRWMPS